MVKIYLADGTLVYNCVFPCGENQLQITYKADYSPNTPNVGLSTSVQNLKFIKTDRTTILTLMTEDLFVQIDTLPKYQMDIANFTDDGDFLEIPLISSSVRDILKNTNLGQIGLTRASKLRIKKTPFLRGVLTSENINTVFSLPADTARHNATNENADIANGWNLSEGVFLNLKQTDVATNFLYINIPIEGTTTLNADHDTEINVDLTLTRQTTGALPNAHAQLSMQSYCTVIYSDGTMDTIAFGTQTTAWQNFADIMTFSLSATWQNYLTFQRLRSGKSVKSAVVAYQIALVAQNITASAWTQEYLRSGNIEIKYQDYIDYTMPAIKFADLVTAVNSSLDIAIDTSLVLLPDLYVTSPNGEEFWNTPIFDILDTIANIYGLLLQITLTSAILRSYSVIYQGASIAVPDFCNRKTNGRTFYYKFAVNDGSRTKLQYANAPVIMWNNEYVGFKNFGFQQTNTLQLKLHIDGAEFLEKMQGDDKTIFLIENSNGNISDGKDSPINYQLSASELTEWRNDEYASEVFGDLLLSPVIDTTPVWVNPDTGIDTRQDIALPATRLCGWETEKFSIPFYSNLINKVLNGDIIKLSIDGDDYLLVDVTCGIAPSQVEITCRKILT